MQIRAPSAEERKRLLLDIIETHSPQSGAVSTCSEFDFSDEKLQDAIGVLPPKKQA